MIEKEDVARVNPTLRFLPPLADHATRLQIVDAQKVRLLAGQENAYRPDQSP